MLNKYIYHQLPPTRSVFVTPSSGRPLSYLLKNYIFLQCCYIGCAKKCKIYPVI